MQEQIKEHHYPLRKVVRYDWDFEGVCYEVLECHHKIKAKSPPIITTSDLSSDLIDDVIIEQVELDKIPPRRCSACFDIENKRVSTVG